MAKAKLAKSVKPPSSPKPPKSGGGEPAEVVVNYDLFDLPTAFHKAGLAGLVLLIESLKARQKLTADEAKYEMTATTVAVTFTEKLVRDLMDDVYDSVFKEVAVGKKWKDAEVVRPPTQAEREADTPFVYSVVKAKGQLLRDHYPDEDGLWLRLWQDMLWSIPRGRPTTREPFNQRAAGQPCKEGSAAWANLLKVHKARGRNTFYTAGLSSALFPGAQDVNAEGVAFEGRAEQNLLLHFWTLTVLLFVPLRVEADGSTELPPSSFTLAVPEVSHLKRFVKYYPALLDRLPKTPRFYRPAAAVVDLPAEGALAFLDNLAAVTAAEVEREQVQSAMSGVEYLHQVKLGNNVKLMAAGRVPADGELLAGYRAIVAPADESTRYRHPLFRRGLLVALLEGRKWYEPFGRTLVELDAEVFIRQPRRAEATDATARPQFASDAAKKLRHEAAQYTATCERLPPMADTPRPPAPPAVILNRVVRTYVLQRASQKTGIELKTFMTDDDKIDWEKVPREFNDAKQKLALGLMLEFRSRKEQAFVDHFAATFFSVTQRLNEPDRLELAGLLIDDGRRDDLKTLTLLALSANS